MIWFKYIIIRHNHSVVISKYEKENTQLLCQTRWLEMEDKKMWKGITQLVTFTKVMIILYDSPKYNVVYVY